MSYRGQILRTGGLLLAAMFLPLFTRAQKPKPAAPASGPGSLVDTPLRKGARAADGRSVGVWEYFDEAGQLELRLDADALRVLYHRPDTARYYLHLPGGWRLVQPSQPPILLGSHADLHNQLTFAYPTEAQRRSVQGTVEAALTIGPDGRVTECLITRSVPGLDAEVLSTVRSLRDRYQWVPAQYRGQPVAARLRVQVRFMLVDSDEQAQADRHRPPSTFAVERYYVMRETPEYFLRRRGISRP